MYAALSLACISDRYYPAEPGQGPFQYPPHHGITTPRIHIGKVPNFAALCPRCNNGPATERAGLIPPRQLGLICRLVSVSQRYL